MKKYKIHFVCHGNIDIGHLAEAFANNLKIDHITASSSGTSAAIDGPNIELSPYAAYVAAQENITDSLPRYKAKTTYARLAAADIIIFMNSDVYKYTKAMHSLNRASCLVWDIDDLDVRLMRIGKSQNNTRVTRQIAIDTAKTIQAKVNQLILNISSVSWADIVDENNHELGFKLPVSWVNEKGLWRRGCHAVILTSDNQYIVEKRSKVIMFNPGHLDVTLGGGVDDGETPEAAIVREVHEELGLKVDASMLKLLEIYKWSSYHSHYKKYTRCFLYTYLIKLDSPNPIMNIQSSEVSSVQLLSAKQTARLVRLHRLVRVGQLSSGYKYYGRVLKLVREYCTNNRSVKIPSSL